MKKILGFIAAAMISISALIGGNVTWRQAFECTFSADPNSAECSVLANENLLDKNLISEN